MLTSVVINSLLPKDVTYTTALCCAVLVYAQHLRPSRYGSVSTLRVRESTDRLLQKQIQYTVHLQRETTRGIGCQVREMGGPIVWGISFGGGENVVL